MEVEKLVFNSNRLEQVVVLKEAEGPRRLSFVTGYPEAVGILYALKGETSPRPVTHQAWLSTVAVLGADVQSACVHDRRDETYFADIHLSRSGDRLKIDVRPSDALIISLRGSVPFLFSEGPVGRVCRYRA